MRVKRQLSQFAASHALLLLALLVVGRPTTLVSQGFTPGAAYRHVQAERDLADSLWRSGDRAGVARLEALLWWLQRPEIRALSNQYPYLANRSLNLRLDLARASLALGDSGVARDWLRAALHDDYLPSPQFVEGDTLLAALLDPALRRQFHAYEARHARRTNAAFATTTLSAEDRVAGLSLVWAEVRWGFPDRERGALPQWDSLYLATLPVIRGAEDPWEFWQRLRWFAARVEDGHTNVYPPPELLARHWARPPIGTERVEGMVVIRGASRAARGFGVEPGAILETIDGEPVETYAARVIAPLQSASTPQDREVRTFSYDLLRGPRDRPVRLGLRMPDGRSREVTVPRDISGDGPAPPVRDSVLPGNIGYLEVRDFAADSIPALTRASLRRLSGTRALVVDLRRNGGGSTSHGFPILQAIARERFALSSAWVLSTSSFHRTQGFDAVPIHLPVDSLSPSRTLRYDQPVVLLVGPMTFSAAEDFAVIWRGIGRGPILGSATGGSTGQPLVFPLPGGGRARVRTKHDVGPGGIEFDGHGVVPDMVVTATIAGLRAGRDEILEAALRHLAGAR